MPAQNDTWWLLRSGEETWKSGQPLLHDTFTHTVAGRYWPNHEWLSQLIFYAAYSLGGMPMLTLVCAGAVIAAWALVWNISPAGTLDRALLISGGAAFSTAGWSLRPQVFTLALFALTLWLLLLRQRAFLWLPLIFLLWANLHGGVAAGGALIVAALGASLILERRIDRRLWIVAALCFFATAATPLGPRLWLEVPASLERLKTYYVLEWRTPSILNPGDLPFFAALAAAIGISVVRRKELRRWDTLFLASASALTALLALRSTRNGALFFLCVVPLAARLLNSGEIRRPELRRRRPAATVAVIATVVFVGYAWTRPLQRLQWHPVSAQMYDALQACQGPLYNRYDEGGYLIWFVRDRPVFIDSRQDPFPESLVLEQLEVERTGQYEQTFQRHDIACALTPARSLLAGNLQKDGWTAHDAGSGWLVYTRPAGVGS
jgi:hypothetical protein